MRRCCCAGWRPISSAPINGMRLLLWHARRAEAVFGRWRGEQDEDITHWMLPPEGPDDDHVNACGSTQFLLVPREPGRTP